MERLQGVQRRLLAILRFVVQECPRVIEQKDRQAVERDSFGQEVLRSRHRPVVHCHGVRCSVCGQGVVGSQVEQVWFLRSHCSGPVAVEGCTGRRLTPGSVVHLGSNVTHGSHQLYVYKGLHFCMVCGFLAGQRINKLGLPCAGSSDDPRFPGLPRTAGGRLNLRRIAKGLLPQGVTGWPAEGFQGPQCMLQL